MLRKGLLIVGALVIGSADSMNSSNLSSPLISGRESVSVRDISRTKMESSPFFRDYLNLYRKMFVQNGFLTTDGFSDLKERMETLRENLREVCNNEIADYSGVRDREISRLATSKSEKLKTPIIDFFKDLRDTLEDRRNSISGFRRAFPFFFSESPSSKEKYEIFGDCLTKLKPLDDLVKSNAFDDLVKDCFVEAYDNNTLRGNDIIQSWFSFRRNYDNGRVPRYFPDNIIRDHNLRTYGLVASILADHSDRDGEVAQWRKICEAIMGFNLPRERLDRCFAADNDLMDLLGSIGEGYRLTETTRKSIIQQWKVSLGGMRQRVKIFVPFVPSRALADFFCISGGTARVESVSDLLARDLPSLYAKLWGTSLDDPRGACQGIILGTLRNTTNATGREKSYLNATLVISDLEKLCTANDKIGHVVEIMEFLKFITDDSVDNGNGDGNGNLYKLPYLGINSNRERTDGVSLRWMNVILNTQTKSFDEVIDGVCGVLEAGIDRELHGVEDVAIEQQRRIDLRAVVEAFRARLYCVVEKEDVEKVDQ